MTRISLEYHTWTDYGRVISQRGLRARSAGFLRLNKRGHEVDGSRASAGTPCRTDRFNFLRDITPDIDEHVRINPAKHTGLTAGAGADRRLTW